jgi:hypothetical protein
VVPGATVTGMGRLVTGAGVLAAALLGTVLSATPAMADPGCGVGAGPAILGSNPAPGPVPPPLPPVLPLPPPILPLPPPVLPLPPPGGPGVLPLPADPCTPGPGPRPGPGPGVGPGVGVGAGVDVGAGVGVRVGVGIQDGPGSSPVLPPAAGDAARPGSSVPPP